MKKKRFITPMDATRLTSIAISKKFEPVEGSQDDLDFNFESEFAKQVGSALTGTRSSSVAANKLASNLTQSISVSTGRARTKAPAARASRPQPRRVRVAKKK